MLSSAAADDVQIYTSTVIVGISSALGYSLMCVPPLPVRKTAVMEMWFQIRFQHATQHFLNNSVPDARNSERTLTAIILAHKYTPDGFGKVRTTADPVPDAEQVVVTFAVKRFPVFHVCAVGAVARALRLDKLATPGVFRLVIA